MYLLHTYDDDSIYAEVISLIFVVTVTITLNFVYIC